jgi:sensor histidine kinase YesM
MKKINIHIFVWLGLFALRFFTLLENNTITASLITSLPLYTCYAAVFYSAAYVHKTFIEKKRYLLYALSLLVILGLGTIFIKISDRIILFLIEDFYVLDIASLGFFRVLFFAMFGILYQMILSKREADDKNKNLQLEKRETELQFLKSQMNPHFFFNTLNNIYGLTYQKDEKAPKAILKLSEAMRYVIYETQSDRVSLMKELQFINNYIELERLRLVHNDNLIYQNEVNWNSGQIAPMILLPFIENCFKHSNIDDDEDSEINISIWIENEKLHLSCGNTVSAKANYKEGGLGTVNVQKRLDLLYNENYSLHTESDEKSYYIHLQLPLENHMS